jgi:transposase
MVKLWKNRDWLFEQYIVKRQSALSLAKKTKCSIKTIRKWLKKYNIPIRNRKEASSWKMNPLITKECLYEKYVIEKKTMKEIGKELNVPYSTVSVYLKRYDIPLRARSENYRGERNPFFGKKHNTETVNKIRQKTKELWNDRDFITKMIKATHTKPNKFEKRIEKILKQVAPEFKYNGDLSLGIVIGRKIPDFISVNGKKIAIECIGEAFHDSTFNKDWKRTEFGILSHYSQYGYKCILLRYHELFRKTDEEIGEEIKKLLSS